MSIKITKEKISEHIATQTGISTNNIEEIVSDIISELTQNLQNSQDIKLTNFANFTVKETPERIGRNPKTGESYKITKRKRISFAASAALTKKINE